MNPYSMIQNQIVNRKEAFQANCVRSRYRGATGFLRIVIIDNSLVMSENKVLLRKRQLLSENIFLLECFPAFLN
jgi:hypothetical protein